MVQSTVQQKLKNQYRKNISKSYKETLSTSLIINSTNYLTRIQWKLAIVVREIAKPSKILFPKKSTEQITCNCLNQVNRPLEQKWFATDIVYKAKLTSSSQNYQEKVYFGSCETIFKSQKAIWSKWM